MIIKEILKLDISDQESIFNAMYEDIQGLKFSLDVSKEFIRKYNLESKMQQRMKKHYDDI